MKICIVTSYFPPQPKACAIRIYSFVKEWSKKENLKILVMTPKSSNSLKEIEFESSLEKTVKVKRFFSLAQNNRLLISRLFNELIWSFWVALKLSFSQFDLLFVSSPLFFQTFITILVGKLRRKECFVDIRDLYPDIIFGASWIKPGNWLGRILKKFEGFIYQNSRIIFTTTNGLLDIIKNRTNTPVYLARNGVEMDLFERELKGNRQKSKYFGILFHGNIGELYDIDFLIRLGLAIKDRKIKDIKIYIYGEGRQSNDLRLNIVSKGLRDIIYFYPPLEYKKIPELIHQFQVGIAPLKKGQLKHVIFPVKVYEFIACGLPVIVSSGSEAANFVTKNNIGISVDQDEIEKTINYLEFLKHNKEERYLIRESTKRIWKEFDRKNIANRIFEEIIKSLSLQKK